MHFPRRVAVITVIFFVFSVFLTSPATAQSVASGTVEGTVVDPSGGVVAGAMVEIRNPITGYTQTTTTDSSGMFRFNNIPFNMYHIQVRQPGFAVAAQDMNVRSTVPLAVKIMLTVAGVTETISVEAGTQDIVETAPYAHSDVDTTTLDKLPIFTPGSSLSDAIVFTSPGVVADSNGFFHPLGDHAQTSFNIDGQPINDQQSKNFSTQLPVNAIQSMEIVNGTPNAEFGDKTSLVVNATTRSGLGLMQPRGDVLAQYGSFGTPSLAATLGLGGSKFGWFFAGNGLRSGRFLDTPEFNPIHAIGNNENTFNRFDFVPNNQDAIHLNLFLARNWFQIPNSLDSLGTDQRQKTVTFDFAPGYQHTFGPSTLLTINPFVRQDRIHYYPSPDPSLDSEAIVSQSRRLLNWGVRGDVSYVGGAHNIKVGAQIMQHHLQENFSLGITDPGINPVCLDADGNPAGPSTLTNPANCTRFRFQPNPNFTPALLPLDLTRGGTPFGFAGAGNVNQFSGYFQDTLTFGGVTLNPGIRFDHYNAVSGSITDNRAEPRFGLSYLIKPTSTVLHAGYAYTMETPYNENLLVTIFPAAQDLITSFSAEGQAPLNPGRRNQFNIGFQQGIGRYVQVETDYFWKFTRNAYDFGVLSFGSFNTPISFPISWDKSKLDGVSFRVNTINIKGFQWYTTIGHNRARYFPIGGSPFRIDHDQAFQQNTNLRYQWKAHGPWGAFTWRYDSGLVAGAVGTLDDVLGLTAAQQSAIGFFCGNARATPDRQLTSDDCNDSNFGATRVKIPATGTEDDDHNPPRIAPHHIFDLGAGIDNLFAQKENQRVTLRFTITNITNNVALYNFLSTFSGTHFIAPRSYVGSIGFVF